MTKENDKSKQVREMPEAESRSPRPRTVTVSERPGFFRGARVSKTRSTNGAKKNG